MIPIAVTGTIILNAIHTQHADWRARRAEYIATLEYYAKISKVYFIENSKYDLDADEEIRNLENVHLVNIPPSTEFYKGKAYQEFEMLDQFVKDHLEEDSFVKVTGRYFVKNIQEIASRIATRFQETEFIIDSYWLSRYSYTLLFFARKAFYVNNIAGKHLLMDESKGKLAEGVIYSALKKAKRISLFPIEPIVEGISGSWGTKVECSESSWLFRLKRIRRNCFICIGMNKMMPLPSPGLYRRLREFGSRSKEETG